MKRIRGSPVVAVGMEEIDINVRRRLDRYIDLLAKWKSVTNLISEVAFQQIRSQHIPDGIQLFRVGHMKSRWLDLGSGAGLPAVVIGSLLANTPGSQITCIDSDSRKCAFLRAVARDLDIPLKVLNRRIETVAQREVGGVEIVTAKAFSSVGRILDLTEEYLSTGAVLLLPRGESSGSEVEEIDTVRYETAVHSGAIGGTGFVLEISLRASRR